MSRKMVLFLVILVLAIAGFTAFYIIDKRVPMDPANSGNTPGNLQNGGLFFEMDDKVFFANASDNNCLYSMNVDESKPKRITSMGVKYISGAEGFLYFYMDSTSKSSKVTGLGSASNQYGIYRCRADGSAQTCLLRDFCGEVQLCGEYLYYQVKTDGGSLHKIKCNKKDQSQVADEYISPVCYSDGVIYFSGVNDDHDIHAMYTTNGDMVTTFLQGHYFFPAVQDGYIYYLDGDANYSLWRTNLYSGEKQQVTSDRVDCFTLNNRHIYYAFSDADSPALRRCDLDGNNKTVLYNGIVNSINLTSRYVYFKVFGDDSMLYHMPLDGSAPATTFVVLDK